MRLRAMLGVLLLLGSGWAFAADPKDADEAEELGEAAGDQGGEDDENVGEPGEETTVEDVLTQALDEDDVLALDKAFQMGVSFKIKGAAAEVLTRAINAGSWRVAEKLMGRKDVSAIDVQANNFPSPKMLKLFVSKGGDPSPAFSVAGGSDGAPVGLIVFGEQNPQVALVVGGAKGWQVFDASPDKQAGGQTVAVDMVSLGDLFKVIYLNEDETAVGATFFSRQGRKVNLAKLTALRKKVFPYAETCVWVEPAGGQLVFWDLTLRGEPYNCADDSQVSEPDDAVWHVPRYYLLNPATGAVKQVNIKAKHCRRPVEGGKIVCK